MRNGFASHSEVLQIGAPVADPISIAGRFDHLLDLVGHAPQHLREFATLRDMGKLRRLKARLDLLE